MTGFTPPEKRRHAEIIVPENRLKKKAGSGGFAPENIEKAQEMIENNDLDFTPFAAELLEDIKNITEDIRSGTHQGEAAIEKLFFPVMQMKAQGGMFGYPLVSEICGVLINFLETVRIPDEDALEIVAAHCRALSLVLAENIRGKNGSSASASAATAAALCAELQDACNRYYKKHAS